MAANKAKCLLLVNHTTKTIHYHHHRHHHQDIANWRILQSDWGKSISSYIFGTWILTSQNFQNFHYCCEAYSDTFGSLDQNLSHFPPFLPCCSIPKKKEKISKTVKTFLPSNFSLFLFIPPFWNTISPPMIFPRRAAFDKFEF